MKKSVFVERTDKDDEGVEKQPFVKPKLTFVQPKLEKKGTVKEITAGFFGGFYP